jgi:hypothetical protein
VDRTVARRSDIVGDACPLRSAAFEALGDPEAHAKILIDPKSDATMPG